MNIKRINLLNFRNYTNVSADFEPDYTVLIGINGAGKTSMLDACSIALGAFVSAMDKSDSNSISHSDVRVTTRQIGSRMENETHYPAAISVEADVDAGHPVSWSRTLNGVGRVTTISGTRVIREYAQELLKSNETNGTKEFPIIAYYGTRRLASQTYSIKKTSSPDGWKRTDGYKNCLDIRQDQEQMIRWLRDMAMIELETHKKVPELTAVENAISQCYQGGDPSVKSAYVRYSVKDNKLMMYTRRKNDRRVEKLPVSSLSDGERNILFMTADIAYRMALLNPQQLGNVLGTSGVVLIDEVDLHLHPQWQKRILADLKKSFPNVQFIVTTHSAGIISNVSNEHIRILYNNDVMPLNKKTFGRNLNDIMLDIMGIDIRPEEITKMQQDFDSALTDGNYSDARQILEKMKSLMGDNSAEVINNQIAYDVETLD